MSQRVAAFLAPTYRLCGQASALVQTSTITTLPPPRSAPPTSMALALSDAAAATGLAEAEPLIIANGHHSRG